MRCTAKTAKGERCRNAPVKGTKLCGAHTKERNPGAKTLYRPEMVALVNEKADGGVPWSATWHQIAQLVGVDRSTVVDWCSPKHATYQPQFADAVTRAREIATDHGESCVFRNMMGYEYTEEELDRFGDVHKLQKYAKGSDGATKLWLTNRRREEWADRKTIDTEGDPILGVLDAMRGESEGH